MKKKTGIIVIALLTMIVVGTAVVFASSSKSISKPTNIQKSISYYSANKDKPQSAFISKEKVLQLIDKNQLKTKNSKVKAAVLKTWDQFTKENDPKGNSKNYIVDPNRMVWVVTTYYPDGINTKAGFYANATLTTILDSETGQLIESKVTGDYQGKQ